jgi:hypothetical protein
MLLLLLRLLFLLLLTADVILEIACTAIIGGPCLEYL